MVCRHTKITDIYIYMYMCSLFAENNNRIEGKEGTEAATRTTNARKSTIFN